MALFTIEMHIPAIIEGKPVMCVCVLFAGETRAIIKVTLKARDNMAFFTISVIQ